MAAGSCAISTAYLATISQLQSHSVLGLVNAVASGGWGIRVVFLTRGVYILLCGGGWGEGYEPYPMIWRGNLFDGTTPGISMEIGRGIRVTLGWVLLCNGGRSLMSR